MVASFTRWVEEHARRFADLPTIQARPAPTPEGHPDHDDGFAHDIAYMRELADRLLEADPGGRRVETVLARPVLDDQDIPAYPGVDVLNTLSALGRDLDSWRRHLDDDRNTFAWWLNEQQRAADTAVAVA